jgi:general secretion pathway protein D
MNIRINFSSYIIVIFLLSGCAAKMAFQDGKDKLSHGQIENGLDRLREATDKEPRNGEYRATYLRAKETIINNYLQQAENAFNQEKFEDAERFFRQVITIEQNNQRSIDGINFIRMHHQHDRLMVDADTAVKQNQFEQALQIIRTILVENPKHAGALTLRRQLNSESSTNSSEQALETHYKKNISIEFRDATLKQIFDIISRTSGLNFVFDKEVNLTQNTSIFLNDSTVESAIYFTLLTNKLEQRILNTNTLLIYPNTESKHREYQEKVIKSFFLTNADAKLVANTIQTILKSKDIVIDEKLNLLIMRDSPDAIRLAEKLIALHDVPEPEVMLEVEILEVKRQRIQELGIKWPDNLALTPLTQSGSNLTLRDLTSNINSTTTGVTIQPLIANAKLQDSDTNLLANPRIRTRNREKAKILIGERIPNVTTTSSSVGFVSESIAYLDVGLKLEVEPTVYLDNDVAIKIGLEVSNVVGQTQTKAGSTAYQIGTRTANTVLRLKDGETQILAGLINDDERSNGNKIPGIGEFPILGRLFGSNVDNSQKTEIVLSITPRLIRNIQRPDIMQSEFTAGTEISFKNSPKKFVTTKKSASTNDAQKTIPKTELASPESLTMDGGKLDWHGPSSTQVGSTFIVQLSVTPEQALSDMPIQIKYDAKKIKPISILEGDFLTQDGGTSSFQEQSTTPGLITINASRLTKGGVKTFGLLTSIVFQALASNTTSTIELMPVTSKTIENKLVNLRIPKAFQIKIE